MGLNKFGVNMDSSTPLTADLLNCGHTILGADDHYLEGLHQRIEFINGS